MDWGLVGLGAVALVGLIEAIWLGRRPASGLVALGLSLIPLAGVGLGIKWC
jgi:hypothetical protein